ncbi:branched-chain amino acid ABC transporter permease [Streptomyces brasiliensis]|uniref:Branched-chain amino acid ABC transporter permease n=1 Tax=Streptomyces brasiliensis TaxID=1954 RepID=A0A917ULH0_9ACTN|nr:branched-chain amino acid ABC transporter permease [Streptomyces brasiliensis]GGJ65659.1 branched-chain amino acid ABC transporter permease [Streptomyces brasiliensis]
MLETLLQGLSSSSIYAVLALGFVVIYKGTKVVNLAHGSVMLLGVYVISLLAPRLGFWPGAVIGILVGAAGAVVIQFMTNAVRSKDHLVMTIMTIGINVMIAAELTHEIGDATVFTGDPWGNRSLSIGGSSFPVSRLMALIVGSVLIGVIFAIFRFTQFGVKLRASAVDAETSSLLGISQRSVSIWSWVIGGGLATVGGIFLAAFPANGLDSGSATLAMSAIPAIIIGGMDSAGGAVLGGLIVGCGEAVARRLIPELAPVLGDSFASVVPFILMLAVLLVRPSGLFGSKVVQRV